MRILKVELQNINSLKSETPIVIDFENENFKDIGLYAITGATGSGKTTILDAITIALYHNVPRFSKSHIKASLQDVVSYGAKDALARVTFENKGGIYEAQWSMRILTKTGKPLANPDEQVRLKNLVSEKIIAEKKTEFSKKIEEITQLNYNQFLRSVMLAQGEFASFLSAKSSEKGTLLEQITGEEIYKKIGEVLNIKLANERRLLNEIKSKINTDDILSDEKRSELIEDQKSLSEEIKDNGNELNKAETIKNWYNKNTELINAEDKYKVEFEILENTIVKNQDKINAFSTHEKAEPYSEIINNISRLKKDISDKENSLKKTNSEIYIFCEKIESAKIETSKLKDEFAEKENDNHAWQSKLEEIAKLDSEINSKKETNIKMALVLEKTNKFIDKIKLEVSNSELVKKSKEKSILEIKNYLSINKNVNDIEKNINNWTSKLTEIKTYSDRIVDENKIISQKEHNLLETRDKFKIDNENLEIERKILNDIEISISEYTLELSASKLDNLLTKKEKLSEQNNNWKDLQSISKQYLKSKNEENSIKLDKINLVKSKEKIEINITELASEIKKAKISLNDAKKIHELEIKIEGFEKERAKLKNGEACALCGSTEHPYVKEYKTVDISSTQKTVNKRETLVEELTEKEKNKSVKFASIISEITSSDKRIEQIINETNTIVNNYKSLNLDCEINDTKKILFNISEIDLEIKDISKIIKKTQNIQSLKEKEEKRYKKQGDIVSKLSYDISALAEKGKSLKDELKQRKSEIEKLLIVLKQSETGISNELSIYNLELPNTDATYKFIENLQTKVKIFSSKKDDLTTITNEISEVKLNIEHKQKIDEEKSEESITYSSEIKKLDNIILELSEKRNNILPINIATETKRSELKLSVEKHKILFEKAKNNQQNLDTELISKRNEKLNTEKQKTAQISELSLLEIKINKEITKSIFSSISDINNALLPTDTKIEYSKIKKNIENKKIELNTTKKHISESFEKQNSSKNFDISEEEIISKLAILKELEKNNFEKNGDINRQIKKDDEIRNRNKSVLEKINTQSTILKKWDLLQTLLGGSRDAFNTYVQRLTLENLITLANVHLFKLNRRYSLKINDTFKKGEELSFVLVDHFQTGRTRPVDTTSGGEKFLISLALALGLSDLASNNVKIDSLFIDEGFGTLDPNMLETVISTLETLQSQGKMIGVISHVENLKERISTQIQIIKNSNGISTVEIV